MPVTYGSWIRNEWAGNAAWRKEVVLQTVCQSAHINGGGPSRPRGVEAREARRPPPQSGGRSAGTARMVLQTVSYRAWPLLRQVFGVDGWACQTRFTFNVSARSLTRAALLDDLPRLLWTRDGVPFGRLVEEITNDTPANSTIVGEVLLELNRAGTLNILGEKGGTRRVHDQIGARDIIKPNRQLLIFSKGR